MPLEVKIPPMGESISSGILAKWHVKSGDVVKKDQPLFELETDKITSEGTAEAAGAITLQVEAGAEVKIGQVVAVIDAAAAPAQSKKQTASPFPAAAAPKAAQPASAPPSPAVRRIAEETNVNPAEVAGTGKAGRVTKGDMLAAAAQPAPSPAPVAAPAAPAPAPAAQAAAPAAPAAPSGER